MLRNKVRAAFAGIAAGAVALGSLGLAGVASAQNAPLYGCTIKTINGHYLTAVGGGGRTTDVIHSDATQLLGWEKFTLVWQPNGTYAIQTSNGHYLTAVGGGGRITDTIHSDATTVRAWEEFTVTCP